MANGVEWSSLFKDGSLLPSDDEYKLKEMKRKRVREYKIIINMLSKVVVMNNDVCHFIKSDLLCSWKNWQSLILAIDGLMLKSPK